MCFYNVFVINGIYWCIWLYKFGDSDGFCDSECFKMFCVKVFKIDFWVFFGFIYGGFEFFNCIFGEFFYCFVVGYCVELVKKLYFGLMLVFYMDKVCIWSLVGKFVVSGLLCFF